MDDCYVAELIYLHINVEQADIETVFFPTMTEVYNHVVLFKFFENFNELVIYTLYRGIVYMTYIYVCIYISIIISKFL